MHQINLHGPWNQISILPEEDSSSRTKYPCFLASEWASRTIKLSRKFHKPSGLETENKVSLEFKLNCKVVECLINGHSIPLDETHQIQIQISDQLESFNEVELILELPDALDSSFSIFESSKLVIH